MHEDTRSLSPSDSSKIFLPKPAGSGLTLVIPSLKSLKASQITAKKVKELPSSVSQSTSVYQDVEPQEKKPTRPVKLKPLKEVLSKLIVQIKRKDDYAFFLTPVNTRKVTGYTGIIKSPMDFGTMADKVNRGKYRSLDDFTSDFKLVTNNAKTFNPPGSIYHAEAERIEAWGLDHISKAASTVIQYETDWTIDVEKDDDEQPVNVDQDEDDSRGTPMDVDGSTRDERSVSVAPQPAQMSTRRGPRGLYRREKNISSNTLSETLEPDGGLPGSKDGIGAFPSGSDWAKTMFALKLKGKRYKTKKERMRIERDGPPLLPDGSLNYSEMEDPFSVLSFFVPDQPSRPQLLPLYPPLYQPPPPQPSTDPPSTQTPSTPQPQLYPSLPTTSRVTSFSSATTLPPDHSPPSLPFLKPEARLTDNVTHPSARRRHWVVNRNAPSRQKGKEREDDTQDFSDTPAWQTPREPSTVDYGSFASLAGALAEEMARRGISSSTVSAVKEVKESLDQDVTRDLIRHSLNLEDKTKDPKVEENLENGVPQDMDVTNLLTKGYWMDGRVAEAEEYIKDVVYGGAEGFAYVRSLAEFVNDDSRQKEPIGSSPCHALHLPSWVIEHIVDPLTEGRHFLLRETAIELSREQNGNSLPTLTRDSLQGTVASQVLASLHLYPDILLSLCSLLHIRVHKIDMASLLKAPHELIMSDEEWVGKGIKKRRKQKSAKVKQEDENSAALLMQQASEVEEPERSWASVAADVSKGSANGGAAYEIESPEELGEVLDRIADIIMELNKKMRAKKGFVDGHDVNGFTTDGDSTKDEKSEEKVEDSVLRNLRLKLLALAKRAPLDTIARLPKDLVPAHLHPFVPTLGFSAP